MKTTAEPTGTAAPSAFRVKLANWIGSIFFAASAVAIAVRSAHFSWVLLPMMALEVIISAAFLIRKPAKRRNTAWYARILAYGASFSFPLFVLFVLSWRSDWAAPTKSVPILDLGAYLWFLGTILGLWAAWSLRHSFSIEPQAREVVEEGPYALARHPIYLSYILQCAGIVLLRLTFAFIVAYCLWFVIMFVRARLEEQVLEETFPNYEAYRRRVWMFGPPNFFNRTNTQPSPDVLQADTNS